jgi:predicted DNA-binding transcriptional regulator AlpA
VPDVLPLRAVDSSNSNPPPESADHARLIDREEFAQRLAVGVSTLDRMRAAGRVGPRPIRFGGIKFRFAEVAAWIATSTPSGGLYDAATWAPVWAALDKKNRL